MTTSESNDNWKHRAKGMRCGTCMWWVKKLTVDIEQGVEIGRCRRHAPTLGGWPVVYHSDWCGDHKVDEEKL